MNKALRNVTALFLAMLLCLCPLSVQAAGVTGDTVLASYRTLIDAYNNFADLHESYLVMLGTQNVSDSVRAYYDGEVVVTSTPPAPQRGILPRWMPAR